MKLAFIAFCLAMLAIAAITPVQADRIGIQEIAVPAPERESQISVTLWYPAGAAGGEPVLVGDNPVFRGMPAFRDAPVAAGAFPIILLAHGGLRSAPGLDGWIASRLAAQGFIVAAPRRRGPQLEAAEAVRELRLRPADLSAALTALQSDPAWASRIDARQVGVLGFELGGASALALAGARLDAQTYARSCDSGGGLDCAWFSKNGIDLHKIETAQVERSHHDLRIKAVVAIDPELADIFTDQSLAGVSVPVEIINLGRPETVMPALNAKSLEGRIPTARYQLLPDATHVDAFSQCKPRGPAILRSEGDDDSLCAAEPAAREAIHDKLAAMISAAFKRELQVGM